METKKIQVLCVADYYVPGYRAGGAIRTIANMSKALQPHIDLHVFSRNHDLNDPSPYEQIQSNKWIDFFGQRVFYADSNNFTAAVLFKALKLQHFDILYLNSLFSFRGSIAVVLAHKFINRQQVKFLIAPRGELSPGALRLKTLKKTLYLMTAKLLGLYDHVYWHASTEMEASDIRRNFTIRSENVFIAPDIVTSGNDEHYTHRDFSLLNRFQAIFISRISPMKNLAGLLSILTKVKSNITLSIYGPIEDMAYWSKCQEIITKLPPNVEAHYLGDLTPEEVSPAFSRADLFIFPTLGENFGHVIFESLRVGTPVLTSDQTPWQAQANGSVMTLPLAREDLWVGEIESFSRIGLDERQEIRLACLKFVEVYLENHGSNELNLAMFREIAARPKYF